MQAAVLSIGDELTSGLTTDANAGWLAARLAARGIAVAEIRCVEDDRARIARAIDELASRHALLITTGGLGPTADDLTREALGDVLSPGEPLLTDEKALRRLEAWFARSGRPMPAGNRKQAMHPRSARIVENPNGTAPALRAERGGCIILVLPGVPREMQALFNDVADDLLPKWGGQVIIAETVSTFGIGESAAAERLGDLLARDREPRIGTTSTSAMVKVRIYARGTRDVIQARIERDVAEIFEKLHPYAFGRGEETLAQSLGAMLRERGFVLTTAESCTGGLLGAMITEVVGSSAWYEGGWITYSNAMKNRSIDVPSDLLAEHGAVSEPVARAMAEGALKRAGANGALAITGIAGPGGGSEAKPLGTVFIASSLAIDRSCEPQTMVREFRFRGDRAEIRRRSALAALQMARLHLLGLLATTPLLFEAPQRTAKADA